MSELRGGLWNLNLLTWNVFLRSSALFHDGQLERTREIVRVFQQEVQFASAHVVVFCEVFDTACATLLQDGMRTAGYAYHTEVLGTREVAMPKLIEQAIMHRRIVVMNGGIIIFSRFPILHSEGVCFHADDINRTDAMALKGFVYVKVKMPSTSTHPCRIAHVIGTHLQATRSAFGDMQRLKQMHRIRQFISRCIIPRSEPLIICGDLNQDSLQDGTSREAFARLLSMCDLQRLEAPTGTRDEAVATVHPAENNLVGRDTDNEIPLCCLDHCCHATTHLAPSLHESFSAVLRPRSIQPMMFGLPHVFYRKDLIYTTTRQLSDHYPVAAKFFFPYEPKCEIDVSRLHSCFGITGAQTVRLTPVGRG